MFDDSNPPSPSRVRAMSPLMRDASRDIDWSTPLTIPVPTPPDPRESPWLAMSAIVPGLFLTCERATDDRSRLAVLGCRLVVRMNAEEDEPPYSTWSYDADTSTYQRYAQDEASFISNLVTECSELDGERAILSEVIFVRAVAAEDSPAFDIAQYFEELSNLIEVVLGRRRSLQERYAAELEGGADLRLPNVVVNCKAGVSRSAAIVLAYLIKRYRMTRAQALAYVKDARPVAEPNHGFCAQLSLWESSRGCRITDSISAAMVADGMMESGSAVEVSRLVGDQLQVLSTRARLVHDREEFGRLIQQLVIRGFDVSNVVHCLDKVVNDGIDEQVYIDSPTFVANVLQIVGSIKRFAPSVAASAAWATGDDDHDAQRDTMQYDDGIHRRWIEWFSLKSEDSCAGAEMLSKYLHAVAGSHLCPGIVRSVSGGSFSRSASAIEDPWSSESEWDIPPSSIARPVLLIPKDIQRNACITTRVPAAVPMTLSFPFLSLLAQHAVGFIPWGTLNDTVPTHVSSLEAGRQTLDNVRVLSRRWFLVARWDGAVAAVGMKTLRRWSSTTEDAHAPSYLHSYQDDIEVRALELMEQLDDEHVARSDVDVTPGSQHASYSEVLVDRITTNLWTGSLHEAIQSVSFGESSLNATAHRNVQLSMQEKVVGGVHAFIRMLRRELEYFRATTTPSRGEVLNDEECLAHRPWRLWLLQNEADILESLRAAIIQKKH